MAQPKATFYFRRDPYQNWAWFPAAYPNLVIQTLGSFRKFNFGHLDTHTHSIYLLLQASKVPSGRDLQQATQTSGDHEIFSGAASQPVSSALAPLGTDCMLTMHRRGGLLEPPIAALELKSRHVSYRPPEAPHLC